MKTALYCFSGTGNSLAAAEALAAALKKTEVIAVPELMKGKKIKISGDAVGFIFPVHAMTLPVLLKEFFDKVELNDVGYVFAVVTRGGKGTFTVHSDLNNILKKKGSKLDAGFYLDMPSNYMIHGINITPADKAKKLLSGIDAAVKEIAKTVSERKAQKWRKPFFLMRWFVFPALAALIHRTKYFGLEKKFYADKNCISCGICEKVCPVSKVKMKNGRPIWKEERACTFCFACINSCPRHAVQFKGMKTDKKGRYHHPGIDFKKIAKMK
jgi:ferredoxin/flavodoxin